MLSLGNYNRPTPRRWKILGDIFLYSIPAIEVFIRAAPSSIDPVVLEYVGWVWPLVSSVIKIVTKYTSEDPINISQ